MHRRVSAQSGKSLVRRTALSVSKAKDKTKVRALCPDESCAIEAEDVRPQPAGRPATPILDSVGDVEALRKLKHPSRSRKLKDFLD